MPPEKKDDDLLSKDAALATDLGDEKERHKEQLAYLGGEIDEDIDEADFDGADRGDVILSDEEAEAAKKAAEEAAAKKKEEEEATGKEEDDDSEEESDDSADDSEEEEEDKDDDSEEESDDSADDSEKEEEEEEEDKKKPQGIPKHRFDEVNQRMKRAEQRLAEIERAEAAKKEAEENAYDFDAAEREYIELVQDGKTDEALAKRKEINAALREELSSEAQANATQVTGSMALTKDIDDLSHQAESRYPVFDDAHEDFNQTMTDRVIAYWQGYISAGTYEDPTDAYVAAIADVVELYHLDDKYGYAEKPAEKKPEKKPVGTKKKPASKALDEASRAVQTPGKGGERSDEHGAAVPDVEDMSDEEFDALPETTQAKLRGDYV